MNRSTAAPVVVTGGTGTLGRHVVSLLLEAGRRVRILTRGRIDAHGMPNGSDLEFAAADLGSGGGVQAGVDGAEVVVHLAGGQKGDGDKARHLVDAASHARVRHLVYISVVGADRVPIESAIDRAMFGYFGEKHAAERIVAESGLPWTMMRATQFHELTLKTMEQLSRMPIVPVFAGVSFQPVAAAEVAERLSQLALGPAAGMVPAFGGPAVHPMEELARSYLEAAGRRRPIVSVPVPGAAARSFREGVNLAPDRAVGSQTWEAFLAERVDSDERRLAA